MANKIDEKKRKMSERMIDFNYTSKNSKYGEFIIQTNDVQFCLITLIWLKSPMTDKNLRDSLEKLTLGSLINRLSKTNKTEINLIDSLKNYLESRNALAHKMNTEYRLTEKECKLSIELGEEIMKMLTILIRAILNKLKNKV